LGSGSVMLALLLLLVGGCNAEHPAEAQTPAPPIQAPPEPRADAPASSDVTRVLLVINLNSDMSRSVGDYYFRARKIPQENVLGVKLSTSDNMPVEEFETELKAKVRDAVRRSKHDIDFIVLTKGVPIRLRDDNGHSVDGHLAAMDAPIQAMTRLEQAQIEKTRNPYFGSGKPFSSKEFGFYLVTRLDGYSFSDIQRMIDSSLAAKPEKGPFVFDASTVKDGGYGQMNAGLKIGAENMRKKGFEVVLDESAEMYRPKGPVMGYAGWASNDPAWSYEIYRALRFKPGAIAETFVSTSGRSFAKLERGQSQIGDLVQQGVTGVKGYVSEPYTIALARPEILFDAYTAGFNLAESFYMASPLLKWKCVVIGDPICRPYGH
jgi:uncharacterized protein (TIGR03790 family)